MSSSSRTHSRTSGFSLAEVLVALAIAAMVAAMLVRFVGSTRVNAARVGEALEATMMAETLLARIASGQDLQRGRTDGRTGDFLWRIEIQPIAFTAVARRVHERSSAAPAEADAGRAATSATGRSTRQFAENAGLEAGPAINWTPYRVVVAVVAPSGRKHVADTVRLGPAQEAAQR
jgi:prepilin-type N-terminal cleavage/methylation domain-containing protein